MCVHQAVPQMKIELGLLLIRLSRIHRSLTGTKSPHP
jgi:hypothetical protein